ncbi:MAG: hypothetical protein NTU43_03085, partial [Bacteroidetes bacterium]|nr:hypothetical protein [Bacteroidota bacterium]
MENRMEIKSILAVVFLLFVQFSGFAQDIITKNDGSEIKAKIVEISKTEIKYKRFDYLDGPTVVLSVSEIRIVKYPNGTSETFNNNEKGNNGNTYSQTPKQGSGETRFFEEKNLEKENTPKIESTVQNGQKVKVLKIVLDVSYPEKKPIVKALCYNKILTLIQAKNSLTKIFSEYNDINTYLSNDCGETTISSSNNNLQIFLKMTKEDLDNLDKKYNRQTTRTYTNEIKQILGYTCKKIILEVKHGVSNFKCNYYVYDGSEISNCFNSFGSYYGINGLILGSEQYISDGIIQVWMATSISEEYVNS